MPMFRKKPVEIEARQYPIYELPENCSDEDFDAYWDSLRDLADWAGGHIDGGSYDVLIDTLEGQMHAVEGDWIIRGVKGEFYPCKPDIFEATYDAL